MPKLADQQVAAVPSRDYEIPDMSDRGEKHHVSYSELATFRDCPLKWQLRYFWRLERPDRIARLDRGSRWHAGLEAHYRAIAGGATKAEARTSFVNAVNEYDAQQGLIPPDEEYATILWMYDDYVRIYGSDPTHRFVDAEFDFEFPLPVPGASELLIVGKIDLETVNTENGDAEIWDHKSASQRDVSKDGFIGEMLLEDQFILYQAAKRELGTPVDRVIYSVARTDRLKRKMLDSERFYRKGMRYPDATLDEIWRDYTETATALVRLWNDPERVYSVPNPRQCGWKCDFQKQHVESRASGRPILEVALDYGMRFKPRRDETGEEVAAPEPAEEGGY